MAKQAQEMALKKVQLDESRANNNSTILIGGGGLTEGGVVANSYSYLAAQGSASKRASSSARNGVSIFAKGRAQHREPNKRSRSNMDDQTGVLREPK